MSLRKPVVDLLGQCPVESAIRENPNYFFSIEIPLADVDLDARGLLPLLIELIARDDDERADHEVRFNGSLVYCSAKRNDSHRLLRYEGAAAQWSGRPDFLPNV